MALAKLLKVVTTALLFSSSVLAGDATNSSQHVVANTMADTTIDMAKVQKFKSLFNEFQEKSLLGRDSIDAADVLKWQEIFDDLHDWRDVLDGSVPLTTLCSERCINCAAGCNPICCIVSGVNFKPSPPAAESGSDSSADESNTSDGDRFSPNIPEGIIFRQLPLPPNNACPCHCEKNCPSWIQDICCITTETQMKANPDHGGAHSKAAHLVADKDGQKPMVSPNEKFWWRPSRPLDCPCTCQPDCPWSTICCFNPGTNDRIGKPHRPGPPPLECPCTCEPDCPPSTQAVCCTTTGVGDTHDRDWLRPSHPESCPCTCQPDCPAYIQAVCCTTSGTNVATRESTHDALALVMETAAGDPVSVWAAVNLTVFDSFITMDLVQGLERVSEITAEADQGVFEITLDVVVGPKDKEQTLKQSFRVIDGSMLMEKEQALLGLGFMARINSLAVQKEFLTTPEEGLPLLTGVRDNSF